MISRLLYFPLVASLLGCTAARPTAASGRCSKVSSVPLEGSVVSQKLKDGTLISGWGGVLDLLENPEAPDSSARQRCTVHMDLIPVQAGAQPQVARVAFWTAEHCLKLERARSAELNVFDPETKKYLRLKISLDVLEEFNRGRELFSRLQPDLLATYLSGANRPSRLLNNGKPIIERGIGSCKADTQSVRDLEPNQTVYCSSVLDLARLEATVSESDLSKSEVFETLSKMQRKLLDERNVQAAQIQAISEVLPEVQGEGLIYWFENWRDRVAQVTLWRSYEAQAGLIDMVRVCPIESNDGVCRTEFREFFSGALKEFSERNPAIGAPSYQEFLHAEANLPLTDTQHNVPWLLYSQKAVEQYMSQSNRSSFGTNFLQQLGTKSVEELVTKTLGESGPLYYAAAPLADLVSGSGRPLAEHLLFKEKTILFKHDVANDQSATFLLQPGDSGSVLLIGNMPVGVVSTVNSEETSGGAAITPLPEIDDEETEATESMSDKKNLPSPSACR